MLPQDGAQRRGPDEGIKASSKSTLEAVSFCCETKIRNGWAGGKKGRGFGAKKLSSHHSSQMLCSGTQDLLQQIACRPFGADFGNRLREFGRWLAENQNKSRRELEMEKKIKKFHALKNGEEF